MALLLTSSALFTLPVQAGAQLEKNDAISILNIGSDYPSMVTLEDLRIIIRDVRPDLDEEEIVYPATFTFDLGCDSLDMFEILQSCAKFYGIGFTESDMANIMTVGDLADIIQQKLNKL